MKEEAKERFERWHARQHELGACRCDGGVPTTPLFAQPGSPLLSDLARDLATAANASADTQFGETKVKFVPKTALGALEARKKAAMAGGTYSHDGIPPEVRQNLELEHQKLLHARYTADFEKGDAITAKRMANSARISYEQARARLEKEFGAEHVGKSIAALERLLALREDFKQLAIAVEDLDSTASSLRSVAEDLAEDAETVKRSLAKLREKLHE